jgi:hypothetical protein
VGAAADSQAARKTAAMRFSLGVNYWPRRAAMAMWERFDAGEIGEDFARIAGLGLDTVRCFLRWDRFAPQADRIDPMMLDRLEALLTLAGAAGLRVMPALFCGHMSGVNWLPRWSLDRTTPRGRYRTLTDGEESPFGIGNMYAGALLEAQLVFARAVSARLSAHPALAAWDIGHQFSNVREPSHVKVRSGEHSQAPADERVVAQWSRRLCDALRESSGAPITAGTHLGDLTQDRDIRLGSLCAPFAFASMQADTVCAAFARNRLDPEVLPFLAMLTAAFSMQPVLVTGFGNPTCPPNTFSAFERFALQGDPPNLTISPDDSVFATYPCLTENEMAFYCTNVLERLHADGRLGAYWWCWADYPDELSSSPPFDEAQHARSFGIVRADGTEKPVASALAAFARQQRTVVKPNDMPMIASAYYYRTLPTSTGTLYEAFLRFVAERRGG